MATPAALAAQLIALAKILEFVAGVPEWAGVLTGAVVMTAYFTAGGLLTSAWVNVVQLAVLTVGFAIAVPWALIAVWEPRRWHFSRSRSRHPCSA